MVDLLTHGKVHDIENRRRVSEAMEKMIENKVSSLVVKDGGGRVVGFVTQRDLVRCIVRKGTASFGDPTSEPRRWNEQLSGIMTPSKDLIFISPDASFEDARSLMSVSGKRHIPVLSAHELLGVITPRDIALAQAQAVERRTAKESYVSTVMPRKGVPSGTTVAEAKQSAVVQQTLALRSGVCNLAHPHKQSEGEDAYLLGPNMVGVADGVGSWWEVGVDPATYARGIMHACLRSCRGLHADAKLAHMRRPEMVLHEAWLQMQASRIVAPTPSRCPSDPF